MAVSYIVECLAPPHFAPHFFHYTLCPNIMFVYDAYDLEHCFIWKNLNNVLSCV